MSKTNILLFPSKNNKGIHPVKHMGKYIFFANAKLLTNNLIFTAISNFWSQRIEGNFSKGLNHITILFKIVLSDGSTRSIGRVQFLKDESQLDDYIIYIQHLIAIKYNHYLNSPLDCIFFEYSIREGAAPKNTIIKQLKVDTTNRIDINHNHYKLPGFINPLDYGVLTVSSEESDGSIVYAMQSSNGNLYKITSNLENGLYHNKVEIYNKGILGLTYEDIQKTSESFIRKTDTRIYFYTLDQDTNVWVSYFNYDIKPTKYISGIQKHNSQDGKFITMDIETMPIPLAAQHKQAGAEGVELVPILISYYDGTIVRSFYIEDYGNNCEAMFHACIDSLLINKYVGHNIYLHNFAKFDSIFLFGHLYKYGKPNIIKNKNGDLISASVQTNRLDNPNQKINLNFYDSLLLLNSSLNDLSIAFDTTIKKDIFPFKFLDQNNLDYNGSIPNISYFGDISPSEYDRYLERFNGNSWSFKQELIKYCETDCISLHEVLTKFSDLIWKNFKINITRYPTITGLAFAIYRSNFMQCSNIPQISNDFFLKLRPAYTGGATDMYIPSNLDTSVSGLGLEKLFCYDVNSLYPYIMANTYVPTGKIMSFQGDITKTELSDKLGYYLVDVTAPASLDHPIIQSAINSNYAGVTIDAMASTLGTWRMIIYSEEMRNAIKFGYKFNVIAGLVFEEKEIIFKDYVDFMYNLRKQYDKSHPINFIAKLLMNSLYGRFGMEDNHPKHRIIDKSNWKKEFANIKIKALKDIYDITHFDKFVILSTKKEIDTESSGFRENHNVNIAIAASITAMGRVFMSQFKNNENIKLYYTDTDSLFTNLDEFELNKIIPNSIGPEIGKLKLEHVINKAVFLAPKAYCLQLVDGSYVIRIKGFNQKDGQHKQVNLNIDSFYSLLSTDSAINLKQEKWFRDLGAGSINILQQTYELKQNSNKRITIYNEQGIAINTIPYTRRGDSILK